MDLQAVIFDMDGVLIDTVKYHSQSWKRVIDEHGLSFSAEDYNKLRGLTRQKSLETILKGQALPDELIHRILDHKNKYFLEFIRKIGPGQLASGIVELLQELRAAHIRIGVASASQNVRPILDRLGIDRFMDAIGDATKIHQSKPAPDVFLYTARGLKVTPSHCLAIEDSEAGIQAALSAGMCVVGIGPVERVGAATAVLEGLAGVHLRHLRQIYAAWQNSQPLAVSLQSIEQKAVVEMQDY